MYQAVEMLQETGGTLGLAYANSVVTDITDIKYPADVTVEQLNEALKNAPVAEETEAETQAPAVDETKAPVVDDGADEGGSNMTIIIIAIVAVVVIAGVVVGIVLGKKKKN